MLGDSREVECAAGTVSQAETKISQEALQAFGAMESFLRSNSETMLEKEEVKAAIDAVPVLGELQTLLFHFRLGSYSSETMLQCKLNYLSQVVNEAMTQLINQRNADQERLEGMIVAAQRDSTADMDLILPGIRAVAARLDLDGLESAYNRFRTWSGNSRFERAFSILKETLEARKSVPVR